MTAPRDDRPPAGCLFALVLVLLAGLAVSILGASPFARDLGAADGGR